MGYLNSFSLYLDLSESIEVVESDNLMWLKTNIEPWNLVQEKWSATYDYRHAYLQKDVDLYEIYFEWPILKENLAYTLVGTFQIYSYKCQYTWLLFMF